MHRQCVESVHRQCVESMHRQCMEYVHRQCVEYMHRQRVLARGFATHQCRIVRADHIEQIRYLGLVFTNGSPENPARRPAAAACRGLTGAVCRNPLGMLERPWCYVEGEPFIERCAIPACEPPPHAATVSVASSRWVTLLAILISIAGLLLIALLIVVLVKIMHGTWTCSAVTTKATPTRTSESASTTGVDGRKLSEVTTVMSARSVAQQTSLAAPAGSAPSQSSLSQRQSSHGGGGLVGSPVATDHRATVQLSETIVDAPSPLGDRSRHRELRDSGSSPIVRSPHRPAAEAEPSAQSPGSHNHMRGGMGAAGWGGPLQGAHAGDASGMRHPMHSEFMPRPHHGPRQQSPDFRHMPNVASPTLQHLIARADSVRSSGAVQPPAPAPSPRPHSAGSTVFPHAHVAHVHARSAAVRKLLLEAETRPHAVEEALAIWNNTDPSQIRAAAMSDTRSHAASSRSDFIQSMHAASGAVNTTPSRATDVHNTDFSASVIDSGTVAEAEARSVGGAVPAGAPGLGPPTSSAFSGPFGGGVPRPWHTAHMRRIGEPEYGGSWEYAASPTGTHASRVAPYSHGYSGAVDGPPPHEFGPPSHSGYYPSVHQSVSSKSGTPPPGSSALWPGHQIVPGAM